MVKIKIDGPMRVLFFINRFAGGGAERVMSTIANHFAENGIEVFIDYDTNYPIAYTLSEKIISLNHIAKVQNMRFFKYGFIRFPYNLYLIRNIIKEINPDYVVSFLTEVNGPVVLSSIGLNTKVIVSEHTRVEGFNNSKKNEFIKRWIYRFADAVTVLTKYDYHKWKKYKNVVYMPNPIALETVPVNILSKEKIVLGVGRFDDYYVKGLDTLLKCWSGVCHKHKDWRLQIAGDGSAENKNTLLKINEELGNINVDFLGFRKDITNIMRRSAIFLLPSRVEGLPMGLIEAMNQSCCCIAYNVETGPSEIIRHNVSGILIENQQVEKLSEALDDIIVDTNKRIKLSSMAQHSIEQYGIDRIITRWKILFSVLTK